MAGAKRKKIKLDMEALKKASLDAKVPALCQSSSKNGVNGTSKNIPIDSECKKYGECHIYCEGDVYYDAMLNQTNLQNNNNKFFIIQLLEDNSKKKYSVWFRWGRVGLRGQSNLIEFNTNLDEAKKVFEKKFLDKTKNHWEDLKSFCKVPGKYDYLKMDRTVKEEIVKKDTQLAVSQLEPKVMLLLKMICDKKNMEEIMNDMKYDYKKTPLGNLTLEQIQAGYVALNRIADAINSSKKTTDLLHACNDFYTRIPHSFGMKTPPLISTNDEVKEKIKMLEALSEIYVAMDVMNAEVKLGEHPLDRYYKSLECNLKVLDPGTPEYKIIEKYLMNSHGSTHCYKMELATVFECVKPTRKGYFKNYGNSMLLWHGSRMSNWVGILKQGLRIAPPEAPVTGYMFGKGIYFADSCSKSANYCFATQSKNDGLLLLSEVSLGNTKTEYFANYNASDLPKGVHSVQGVGKKRPKPEYAEISGVKVPIGMLEQHPDSIVDESKFSLMYNEYIVYDVRQVRMKYLLHVKFKFD